MDQFKILFHLTKYLSKNENFIFLSCGWRRRQPQRAVVAGVTAGHSPTNCEFSF